jgi:tetratricopeptide (TPR) repeat protein
MKTWTGPIRRLISAAAAVVVVAAPVHGQPPDARMAHVDAWLHAVSNHEPGTADDYTAGLGEWTPSEIRSLWIDTNVLAQLMRNPRLTNFNIGADGPRPSQAIRYTASQLSRLRILACAAAGIVLTHSLCTELKAASELDSDLRRLSERVMAERLHGEDGFVLRRGALLHTDIAMFVSPAAEPLNAATPLGPQRVRMRTMDGLQVDMSQVAAHWELARMLLDALKTPGRDEMVRRWYRATAAWMESSEDHDTDHLNRARTVFPHDPDLLFLSACQHEAYASAEIQSSLRAAAIPTGVRIDVGSDRAELRQAEGLFRQALAANPAMPEAHLRLGRVLSLLDRRGDAIPELRAAIATTDEDLLQYYGQLFLGAAEDALGHFEAARDAFMAAQLLFVDAQSPRLALSALARRRGDRAGALRELQQVLAAPADMDAVDDPWWTYYSACGRNADDLLEELRKPFLREVTP